MNSSQVKEKNTLKNEVEKNSADPFASDIFAGAKTEENIETEIAPQAAIEKPAWVWRLPKVLPAAVDWNALRKNLPADFSGELPRKLADALGKLLNFGTANPVEFLFLTERETSEIAAPDEDSCWLNFGFEQSEAEFAVEIDDIFAVWLVDAMLGEKKSDREKIRNLTPSEIAVLEFLAVSLTHQANKIINAPLFVFRSLSRKSPALANRMKNGDAETSLLVANWQTVHGFLNSIVKIYAAPETLQALDANQNELLTAPPRRRKIWDALLNRVKELRVRLFLGDVSMTLADAAGLETGDVVLTGNYNFSLRDDELNGGAEIYLGDGEHIKIAGSFVAAENEPAEFEDASNGEGILVRRVKSNQLLRVVVARFDEAEAPQFFEKFMTNTEIESNGLGDETETEELDEGGGIALENLAVTLRVELEARRLSLEEVGNLRINQIIELGASAADPVNLLVDNKIVARGELVEVENRLGVRIIQILR